MTIWAAQCALLIFLNRFTDRLLVEISQKWSRDLHLYRLMVKTPKNSINSCVFSDWTRIQIDWVAYWEDRWMIYLLGFLWSSKPYYLNGHPWYSLNVIEKQILALAIKRLLYPEILYLSSGAENIIAKYLQVSLKNFENFYLVGYPKWGTEVKELYSESSLSVIVLN